MRQPPRAVCPSCAERYRQDAYHLIGAGLRGGKGLPDSIVAHPAAFVTFTAPSFGLVHTQRHGRDGQSPACRPRRDANMCPHGVRLSCGEVHADDDPCLGEPICPECFDHEGAVLRNNALGEVWRRTTPVYLPRVLARLTAVTQQRLREQVRVSYVKVAEYQRRGLVHLHAVIRLDKAMPAYRRGELRPPGPRFTAELLEDAIRTTTREVFAPLPAELGGGTVRWGHELHIRHLDATERRRVAGYLAKYATKSTEQAGGVLHRVDADQVELNVSDHGRRYLHAAFGLDERVQAVQDDAASAPAPPAMAAETARDPNRLAWRAVHSMSTNELVRVRLRDGAEHTGRIVRRTRHALVLHHGHTLVVDDIDVIATAASAPGWKRPDRRLAACAHQLGYRGHCLTKSRRYSTTFKALREARERHVHEQLLKRSQDAAQRGLAESAAGERITSFRYAGQGHLTAADALLAASAAARAREQRRAAREARAMEINRRWSVSEKVTRIDAGQADDREPAVAAVVIADEGGLRRLAELLAPHLPVPADPSEPDRWLSTREAAQYAGSSVNVLHKAMAARAIHFEQETQGGKAWFKRADIDAWRRGERPGSSVRRAA